MNAGTWSPGWASEFAAVRQCLLGAAQDEAATFAGDLLRDVQLIKPSEGRPWRPGRAAIEGIPGHPYLVASGFPLEPFFELDGELLVPMFDCRAYGRPIGLQMIGADGRKRRLAGQRLQGAIHRFGGEQREVWLVVEYVDALSLRAAIKKLYRKADVVACFSPGNVVHVAAQGIGTHVMADHYGQESAFDTGLPYCVPPNRLGVNEWQRSDGVDALCRLMQAMFEGLRGT